jgi:hypothetical protein
VPRWRSCVLRDFEEGLKWHWQISFLDYSILDGNRSLSQRSMNIKGIS